jgi:hypothetical protein
MAGLASEKAFAGADAPKKPYEKPSIAWEESVEEQARLMSACGKLAGSGMCDGVEEVS